MKRLFILLLMMTLGMASVSAQTAYAIWDSGQKTLYFDYLLESDISTYYTAGTSYWEVDYTESTPPWSDSVKNTCEKVVFNERFADYYPKTTSEWFCEFRELTGVQDIKNLRTDSVTNMSMMFYCCYKLTSLDLSSFSTSKVTNMYCMFSSSKFFSLDLSAFDTSNVTIMTSMFSSCELLESVNLSSFDTSKVRYMASMFFNCEKLASVDVSGFDTSEAVSMKSMFRSCHSLTSLDLSNFNTSKVEDMRYMFHNCYKLTTIYCNDTWTAETSEEMFSGSTLLKGAVAYDETKTDATMANPTTGYFTMIVPYAQVIWCEGNNTLYFDHTRMVEAGGTYDGQTVTAVWSGDDVLKSPSTTIAGPAWHSINKNVKKVVFRRGFADMRPNSTCAWFAGMTSLTDIEGMENLNTSEVTTMNSMFMRCSALASVDLSNFNTSRVTNMESMFSSCSSLTSLDLSDFDTSKVTTMEQMMRNCSSLTELDLTRFDISKLTTTYAMFYNDESLTAIYCNDDWGKGYISTSILMFDGCKSLIGAVPFDSSRTDITMANPTTGYFTSTLHLKGDVNEDKSVDINDVVAIINHMAGTTSFKYANVNHDANVDINDVVAVINIMAGGTREYEQDVEELECLSFTVGGVTFKMVKVDGGTFQMGSDTIYASNNEKPVHSVTISDYYIGQTEVTQELWQAVMDKNPSNFNGTDLPVEQVSWNDCQKFTSKLSALTGRQFRLPTEAEWEYAARGGSRSKGTDLSGSRLIDPVAWYKDNSEDKTHEVATKDPNEIGAYDMSGNVYEWCQDRFALYSDTPQTDPTGPESGDNRVVRGGGYDTQTLNCRVTKRQSALPTQFWKNIGLRLAL